MKNAIIGKNQAEGVHCDGHCTLEYVWFEDVCEDAISIKNDKAGSQSWIIGGGAYHASDKVVQHNGCGTVNIINYVSYLACLPSLTLSLCSPFTPTPPTSTPSVTPFS